MMFGSTQGSSPGSTAIETIPELGRNPVALEVDLDTTPQEDIVDSGLATGIRQLFAAGTLCDVTLVVGEKAGADSSVAPFRAHRVVLASASKELLEFIESADAAVAAQTAEVVSQVVDEVGEAPATTCDGDVAKPTAVDEVGEAPAATCDGDVAKPSALAEAADAEATTMPSDQEHPAAEAAPPAASSPPIEAPRVTQEEAPEKQPSEAQRTEKSQESSSTMAVPGELRFPGISSRDAVQAMLDYIYEPNCKTYSAKDYSMPSDEANKDVLRLAKLFGLKPLQDRAVRHLTTELSTNNVIDRLATCDEFELVELRGRILERIVQDEKALSSVSGNFEIMKHPRILQDLLVQVAAQFSKESVSPEKSTTKRAAAELPSKVLQVPKRIKKERIALAGA